MCYFRYTLSIIITFIGYFSILAEARVTSIPSSNHVVTGEISYITYIIENPTGSLIHPDFDKPNATLKVYSNRTFRRQGRQLYQITYIFNATETGTYTIPSATFTGNTEVYEPTSIIVSGQESLQRQHIQSTTLNPPNQARNTYPFYSNLAVSKTSLFPNEATQLEYKIYLPSEINIAQWGLPTGLKENATAWRFETPRAGAITGAVLIEGIQYQVGTFHTTVSGIKPGLATIGPFKSRIVHKVPVLGGLGLRSESQKMHLESGSIKLNIRDLPPNPPADFNGDVGHYTMSVHIETDYEISASESIQALVILRGQGKLAEISPPTLTNDEHWKLISQSKRELGQQRKETTGIVEFDYLIQPSNSGPATTTPGFSYSYLDPDLEAYTTISYPGLPIKINLSSNINEHGSGGSINSSQMLGIIQQIKIENKTWFQSLSLNLIHVIPTLICLSLIFILVQRKYRAYRLNQSHKIIQSKTLKEMSDRDDDDFLKAASNYIQRWVDVDQHPELKEIQELRDDHCYKPNSPVKISTKRKQNIIDALKNLMILLLCFTPYLAKGSAYDYYEKGEYQNALTEYQAQHQSQAAPSSDLLYNIGNCYQKLNKPAEAAIHYHKALELNPYHTRSLHNLGIIQQNNNSIVTTRFIEDNSFAYWISYLPQASYYVFIILSLWFTVISVLWIWVLKPTYKTNTILISISVTAIALSSFCYFAYHQHPDATKIPPSTFAIVSVKTNLLDQPTDNSSEKIQIPIASECSIISNSGTYCYIELADLAKTRGWALTEHLMKLSEQ